MAYWLFKSEPNTFSIDDLMHRDKKREPWDGVRNYQARNFMRDQVKLNDLVLFYHSSCPLPGIVGIVKIVKTAYPDPSAWDKSSPHYDPKSSATHVRWYQVDVEFVKKFNRIIPLSAIKQHEILKHMQIARQGNRLSITPVTENEWRAVTELALL